MLDNLDQPDDRPEAISLLASIKAGLPALEALLDEADRVAEDRVYRFYHQSFKVFHLQAETERIVAALQSLAPERPLDDGFKLIITNGTGKTFKQADNRRWPEATRPIIEAFFHARYFLAMAVKYGKTLDHPPSLMPSGWAAILSLFGLR